MRPNRSNQTVERIEKQRAFCYLSAYATGLDQLGHIRLHPRIRVINGGDQSLRQIFSIHVLAVCREPEQQLPQAVQIGLRTDWLVRAEETFGSCKCRVAERLVCRGQNEIIIDDLAYPEVDHAGPTIVANHNVVRFDIPMGDASTVRSRHALDYVAENPEPFCNIERVVHHPPREIPATVFRDEICGGGVGTKVDNSGQPFRIQRPQGIDFLGETSQASRVL